MKKIISAVLTLAIIAAFSISACAANFTMNAERFNIRASDIISIEGVLATDSSQYARNAAAFIGTNDMENVPENIKGQMLLHGGKGDTYTFTVDFTGYNVKSLDYSGYGLSDPVTFDIYADNAKLGTGTVNGGNGWADADSSVWENGTITFPSDITGVVTVKLVVTDSSAAWPANAFGNFNFVGTKATAPVQPSNPTTSDAAVTVIALIVVIAFAGGVVIKKRVTAD